MTSRQAQPQPDRLGGEWYAEFERMLRTLNQKVTRNRDRDLAGFKPHCGDRYDEDRVMVVGIATNGWEPKFKIGDEYTEASKKIHEPARLDPHALHGPACWVQTSRFWQLIRSVVCARCRVSEGGEWITRICWNNLAKIAPADGGNPGGVLWREEVDHCRKLLEIEIDALQPRTILVLTGRRWYGEFADVLGEPEPGTEGKEFVLGVSSSDRRIHIFCEHPRSYGWRKPAEEILDAWKKYRN